MFPWTNYVTKIQMKAEAVRLGMGGQWVDDSEKVYPWGPGKKYVEEPYPMLKTQVYGYWDGLRHSGFRVGNFRLWLAMKLLGEAKW